MTHDYIYRKDDNTSAKYTSWKSKPESSEYAYYETITLLNDQITWLYSFSCTH